MSAWQEQNENSKYSFAQEKENGWTQVLGMKMEGEKLGTREDSGGNQLASDDTTGLLLSPAGFGSVAAEFLKDPYINKQKR